MPVKKVHIRAWAAGDWYEVFVDGVEQSLNSGHLIGDGTWIDILRQAGIEVTVEEVQGDDDDA